MTDITVALTAHRESVLIGPTLRSAEAAIAAAEATGFTVERLIGLDCPNAETRNFLAQERLRSWRQIEYEHGDQGLVRNELARRATGRFLAFLDADDLFSENWLLNSANLLVGAEQKGRRLIVHPEINWIFEKNASVLIKTPQNDLSFVPEFFYFGNHYDALCIAQRNAYIETPYSQRDIVSGYAYEDMQWSIETMAKGWIHVVAPDTIIFKRRRSMSQTIRASQRKVVIRPLEAMRIDRIRDLAK